MELLPRGLRRARPRRATCRAPSIPWSRRTRTRSRSSCADDVGAMHADVTRVRQVLFNLLSNACKFTEKGTITLDVAPRRGAADEPTLLFSVSDTGHRHDRRSSSAGSSRPSPRPTPPPRASTAAPGLGLVISRRFCQMMGGDIAVDERAREGLDLHRAPAAHVVERQAGQPGRPPCASPHGRGRPSEPPPGAADARARDRRRPRPRAT